MRLFIAVATMVGIVGMTAMQSNGPPKKEDIPKLISTLKTSPNAKVRVQAVEDIGYRGAIRASDVDSAIEPMIHALKSDKDAEVRRACAKALGSIGTNAEKCVPSLIESLKDSALVVKIAAAQALGQFGPEAKEALPALRDLAKMKDSKDDKKVSQVAAAAVKSIMVVDKKK
jgi:HEAT repeat protein